MSSHLDSTGRTLTADDIDPDDRQAWLDSLTDSQRAAVAHEETRRAIDAARDRRRWS